MGYLSRTFRASEEENRLVILDSLPRAPGGALLDLGTHKGDFAARVAERVGASRVQGIEFLDEHLAEARSKGIDVVQADLEDGIPVDGERFDVVHANQIIEHLKHTDAFLSEIRRVLKPDGVACISTNNLSSWHNIVSLALGFQPSPMHVSDRVIVGNPLNPEQGLGHEDVGRAHVRLFTARALCELASHCDLELVELRYAGYYPLPPRLARLALRLDGRHGAFLVALFRRARAGARAVAPSPSMNGQPDSAASARAESAPAASD